MLGRLLGSWSPFALLPFAAPIMLLRQGMLHFAMPLILTRRRIQGSTKGFPSRLGEYETLLDAAQGLSDALKTYAEYGSNPEQQCWWAKDHLGTTYLFEVRGEPTPAPPLEPS